MIDFDILDENEMAKKKVFHTLYIYHIRRLLNPNGYNKVARNNRLLN